MKRLMLLRHAKSSWADERLEDFDRPLAPRGARAADALGQLLAAEGLVARLVLCSAARRTVETWKRVAPLLRAKVNVRRDPALYLAEPEALLDRLRAAPDEADPVMLVGHNPGMEMLARSLSGAGDRSARRRLAAKYPTGALAILDFDIKRWSELAKGKGRLVRFVTPKELT